MNNYGYFNPDHFYLFNKHLDFKLLKQESTVLFSGRGPSTDLHLGHLLLLSQIEKLNKAYSILYQISDDEKRWRDNLSALSLDYTVKQLKSLLLKMGLTDIFVDSEHKSKIYGIVQHYLGRITFKDLQRRFGYTANISTGTVLYTILQISMVEYICSKYSVNQVVVVSGIDQLPYFLLARDILKEKGSDIVLAFCEWPTFPGLKNYTKMTSSEPKSCIFVSDDPSVITKKILKSISAGHSIGDIPGISNLQVDFAYRACKIMNIPIKEYEQGVESSTELKLRLIPKIVQYIYNFKIKLEI